MDENIEEAIKNKRKISLQMANGNYYEGFPRWQSTLLVCLTDLKRKNYIGIGKAQILTKRDIPTAPEIKEKYPNLQEDWYDLFEKRYKRLEISSLQSIFETFLHPETLKEYANII